MTRDSASDAIFIAYAEEVAAIVNDERAAQGLEPLMVLSELNDAATIRAVELCDEYAHERPDGTASQTVLDECGIYDWYKTGENIGYGYTTPTAIMEAWMSSTSGHRANILSEEYQYIGVGVAYDEETHTYYWAQRFLGTDAVYADAYYPEHVTTTTTTTITTLSNVTPPTDSTYPLVTPDMEVTQDADGDRVYTFEISPDSAPSMTLYYTLDAAAVGGILTLDTVVDGVVSATRVRLTAAGAFSRDYTFVSTQPVTVTFTLPAAATLSGVCYVIY